MHPRMTVLALIALTACQAPPPDRQDERQTLYSQLPARPYSGVVRVGPTYYFSGKVGVTDETRAMTEGRTAAEVRNIMEAFRELFEELGIGFGDVVKGDVFLADVNDYDAMNAVYAEYFPEDPPARTTVAVAALPGAANVEIAFVAVRTNR